MSRFLCIARFRGGPADGKVLEFGRSPTYLRVVTVASLLDDGDRVDVLDQLDDTPAEDERVSVYRLAVCGPAMHLCRLPGGCQTSQTVEYSYMPTVDGEQLRDTDVWREWATARPMAIAPEHRDLRGDQ